MCKKRSRARAGTAGEASLPFQHDCENRTRFSQSAARFRASWHRRKRERLGARLALGVGVAKDAALTSPAEPVPNHERTDFDLLVELAETYEDLHRLRLGSAAVSVVSARSKANGVLERRAAELRALLSPPTLRLLDALATRHISPPIAVFVDKTCGQCHVRLPTALASAVVRDSTLHRCPHCKRVLVRAASDGLASAS
jgi:hypothetical protein